MVLISILLGTFIAGVGSVWLAAALTGALARFTQHLLSMAAGALLATALLHLLPEALESKVPAQQLMALTLGALVFFFLLDKAQLWHHGHEHAHGGGHGHGQGEAPAVSPSSSLAAGQHAAATHGHSHGAAQSPTHGHDAPAPAPKTAGGWAVLLGDSVHCFGDGVLIAAAFVADVRLGVVATLAVLAHEVPHHIGDLAVLRQSSASLRSAALKVSAAGAVSMIGGLVGYGFHEVLEAYSPYFLVVGASSFIYVALADLIPQLQTRLGPRETGAQIIWLGAGIALVSAAMHLAH